MNIFNLMKRLLIGFIRPLICDGDKEVYYDGQLVLPYYVAFEVRFMLDTLFYSLWYVFILYQFYPTLIAGIFEVISIYVITFWLSTIIFNTLKYKWKYEWKSKHL